MIAKHKSFIAIFAAALVFIAGAAHAVITGTDSQHQQQQFRVGQMQIGMGTSTGTNTPTITNGSGIITTAALATAAGSTATITMTNSRIAAGDQVFASLDPNGSAGTPIIANVAVSANTAVFIIQNIHAANALNAAVKISFIINKAGNSN